MYYSSRYYHRYRYYFQIVTIFHLFICLFILIIMYRQITLKVYPLWVGTVMCLSNVQTIYVNKTLTLKSRRKSFNLEIHKNVYDQ